MKPQLGKRLILRKKRSISRWKFGFVVTTLVVWYGEKATEVATTNPYSGQIFHLLRLQKQIRAAISEYERAKITERMVRGKRSKTIIGGSDRGRPRRHYAHKRNGSLFLYRP